MDTVLLTPAGLLQSSVLTVLHLSIHSFMRKPLHGPPALHPASPLMMKAPPQILPLIHKFAPQSLDVQEYPACPPSPPSLDSFHQYCPF